VPEKQNVSFSQPDSPQLLTVSDTNKYLFQDDPILSKLKLMQEPKAEVIPEYDENGLGIATHMFDKNGKYLGIADFTSWIEEDTLDEYLQKFDTHEGYLVKKHINKNKRKEIWRDLKNLGFQISEREFNKMNYIYGQGLSIGLALQPFTSKAYGFIGTRSLSLDEYLNNDGLPDIFFHQTYLFDYTGKLIKIFNYNEMGQNLSIFDGGKIGISEFRNSDWDEISLKNYRYHDFENNTFFDYNPFNIFNIFKEYPYSAELYFIDIKESYINMVYNIHDKENTYINLMIDVKNKMGYFKTFQVKSFQGLQWKFLMKPDGSKIDLSEYEKIKF
jgi:hypothetical protein